MNETKYIWDLDAFVESATLVKIPSAAIERPMNYKEAFKDFDKKYNLLREMCERALKEMEEREQNEK